VANEKHLEIIKEGRDAWNEWRAQNPEIQPDLQDVDLTSADLSRADLSDADLYNASLIKTNLVEANLIGAKLSQVDFSGSNLTRADLSRANITRANFIGAKLFKADLIYSDLSGSNLTRADLSRTNLISVNLSEIDADEMDLTEAIIGWTIFADTDLSRVNGLETVIHKGPSTIGIDTLYKSAGKVPEVFLRGCGVPDDFITFIPSHFGSQQAIQFFSCFISYSTKDEGFARRLYSRMRDEKLRVWFSPEDIKGGEKLHEQIERAIQLHDRLLIILSENSMQSEWVMTELRKARKQEIREKRRKLFPIRIVSFDAIREWECFDADSGKDLAVEIREYFIPDFSNWKDHDRFEASFDRLLKDLCAADAH